MKNTVKILATVVLVAFGSLAIAKADSYTLTTVNLSGGTTSTIYDGYWKEHQFWITNGSWKATQKIQFIDVVVEWEKCTTTLYKNETCSKNESVSNQIKDLLARESYQCIDAERVKEEIRKLVNQLYDKNITSWQSNSCQKIPQVQKVAVVSDIIYEKAKVIYKEVVRYMLPKTGASY